MRPLTVVTLAAQLLIGAASVGAQVPANAHRDADSRGWGCDDGFVKRAAKCVPLTEATDKELRRVLIDASLAEYPGNCPCPYNVDRAGRSCGQRSAYSRPGGRSPLCYESDISDFDVKAFRERLRSRSPRPGGHA